MLGRMKFIRCNWFLLQPVRSWQLRPSSHHHSVYNLLTGLPASCQSWSPNACPSQHQELPFESVKYTKPLCLPTSYSNKRKSKCLVVVPKSHHLAPVDTHACVSRIWDTELRSLSLCSPHCVHTASTLTGLSLQYATLFVPQDHRSSSFCLGFSSLIFKECVLMLEQF